MNREEAIRKLEYSKKVYQMLIDEKVDSGKLVGKDVKGEWKADTPLDEAYKSMIEALGMGIKAIKALEQEPYDFARWVATEIFDENWEYNKEAFAEIACRKLAKLGIVIRMGDEWELVESEVNNG